MRFAGWVFLLLLAASEARPQVLDAIVARVDGRAITWSQLLQERAARRALGEPQAGADSSWLLKALVRRRLYVAEAEKLHLDPDRPPSIESVDEASWRELDRFGVSEEMLRRRAGEIALIGRYLALRREMTYVSETEVRAFFAEHPEVFGETLEPAQREEIRRYLAVRKFRRDLVEWLGRQSAQGRVDLLGLPEESPRGAGESAGQGFSAGDSVYVSFSFTGDVSYV